MEHEPRRLRRGRLSWLVEWIQACAYVKRGPGGPAGRWTNGMMPQRVKWSWCAQSPLYPQWPRLDSTALGDSRAQYTNTSSRCNPEIRSQARAIPGTAALVTTPLRSLVTRAASLQSKPPARLMPGMPLGIHDRCRLSAQIDLTTGAHRRRRSQPRPWLRECETRYAVAGKACGLCGQPR